MNSRRLMFTSAFYRGGSSVTRAFSPCECPPKLGASSMGWKAHVTTPESWPQWRAFESGGFGLAGHEICILHGLPGGAFAEVVDGTQGDDQVPLGIGEVGDEDQIRPGGPLAVRGFVRD